MKRLIDLIRSIICSDSGELQLLVANLKTQKSQLLADNKDLKVREAQLLKQLVKPPKPILRRTITASELRKVIRKTFPEGEIYMSFSEFNLCDIEDIEAVLDVDETNHIKYGAKFTCSQFAKKLWAAFTTPEWAGYVIALLWTDVHALIFCLDVNLDLWIIEPQDDTRRSDLLSWQGTKMRFCIPG